MGVAKCLGVVYDLDPVLLAGTVLAWGNCLGDLVADTALAKDGYSDMAVAACFSSPLFSLTVGRVLCFVFWCLWSEGWCLNGAGLLF